MIETLYTSSSNHDIAVIKQLLASLPTLDSVQIISLKGTIGHRRKPMNVVCPIA